MPVTCTNEVRAQIEEKVRAAKRDVKPSGIAEMFEIPVYEATQLIMQTKLPVSE